KTACCRHGPGSPAASARIHPVLRRSSPSRPSTNRPAFNAVRSCSNNGRIRFFTSRSDDAHNASVVSIDAPVIHDLRIMVTHGFRNQQNAPVKNYNCNASPSTQAGAAFFGLGWPWSAKARSPVRGFEIGRHNVDAFVVGSYLVRNQDEVTSPTCLTIPQLAHCYSSAGDIPFVVSFC